ncbi:MAG: citramalate synthase [Deltaproteobacteria bacterium]|nr:MAG: citramalate synthase [Deltaproteobacteria bacterium]
MKIQIYDTTLRDGTQAEEISFTVEDKIRVAERLDDLGVDYIEGGWPGSNPKDNEFFQKAKKFNLKNAKMTAFGSTRRKGISADQDKILLGLVKAQTPVITIFGKSWDLHVREALNATLEENLEIIFDSIQFLKKHTGEVIYDAEHFFDGYKANPDYCLKTLQAAAQAGADRIVLCDTNGGTLPKDVFELVTKVSQVISKPLGIHCHNDAELAVANSLTAVDAGATQIHGTINGIGERCGNANLISVIPNLKLKMGQDCVSVEQLTQLRSLSRFVYELANRTPQNNQAYVGDSAFAHKGGVHVSAILKNQKTYEHILPEQVGNRRRVLISDLSGQSNILYKAQEMGMDLDPKDPAARKVVDQIKDLENQGYQFEGAEASFEILMKRALKKYQPFFKLLNFKVVDEKSTRGPKSTATLNISVENKKSKTTASGRGPINALDACLRKALQKFYPQIKDVQLVDYKVRVLPAGKGTASQVRVLIQSRDKASRWGTVGVSENIIEASWQALVDSLEYKLLKD